MNQVNSVADKLPSAVNGMKLPSLPTLVREIELPVYVIHNSADVEDYVFIFDFEAFVEQSRQGSWVRPTLRLWAGRSDFDRRIFAREFRKSFAREFDLARAELARQNPRNSGWFGGLPGFFRDLAVASIPGVMSNLVLLVALSAESKVLAQMLPLAWTREKSDQERLEEGIAETRDWVDAALRDVSIALHIDLYRHARGGHSPEPMNGTDIDAWPLPAHVQQHILDGTSGSWW